MNSNESIFNIDTNLIICVAPKCAWFCTGVGSDDTVLHIQKW
jgi:hypothetical protein